MSLKLIQIGAQFTELEKVYKIHRNIIKLLKSNSTENDNFLVILDNWLQ